MNVSQIRNSLRNIGEIDFAIGKTDCHIIYKGVAMLSCNKSKTGRYSLSAEDIEKIRKEMKFIDNIFNIGNIISIITHPIRAIKRYKIYKTFF